MLAHPLSTTMTLIEMSDMALAADQQAPIVKENYETLSLIIKWVENFLCKPNALLGREGPVCPYTRTAIDKQFLRIAIQQEENVSLQNVEDTVAFYRDWFLELEPKRPNEAQFKSIIVLFPHVTLEDAPAIIDTVQRALKPAFVAEGLMLGQFHAQNNDPGLWNENFRPLRTPVPLLAIRQMVPTDFPFLCQDPNFLASYLKICGNNIPRRLQPTVNKYLSEYNVCV